MIKFIISAVLILLISQNQIQAQTQVIVGGIELTVSNELTENPNFDLHFTDSHIYAVYEGNDLYNVFFTEEGIEMDNKTAILLPTYVYERDWEIVKVTDIVPEYVQERFMSGPNALYITCKAETGDMVKILQTETGWQLQVGG